MMSVRGELRRLTASGPLRDIGGTTVALIASQALMAVAGVLASRALGPSGRGVVTAVLSWPVLLGWLSLLGLNTAASVRVARGQQAAVATTLGSAVVHSVVVGGVVAVGAIAVIPAALKHLGQNADGLAVFALATIPTIVLADILMSVNVALGRLALANSCRVAAPVVTLCGTILLMFLHAVTPERIVAVTIAGGIVALALGGFGLPWRRITLSAPQFRADLKFGAKAHVAGLLNIANARLDLLIMSVFLASSQVGYYSVANNLMMPVMAFASASGVLLTPRVAGMGRRDRSDRVDEAQFAVIREAARGTLIAAAGGAVLLAALAPLAVPLLFGSAFQPVVVLVWVLIPGYAARTYASQTTAGTLGVRRPWVGNVTEAAGIAVTTALLPILLPRYDALGAAITTTASYCTSALVAVYAIRRLGRQVRSSSKPTGADYPELSSGPATAVVTRGG
jgi:O-antigen/teichoic acid export membrane protein